MPSARPLADFLLAAFLLLLIANAVGAIPLKKGDTVLFYGNGMVERLLEHGELEARLQLANPEADLRVRSLAWTGDEVGWRLRPEGYVEHLRELLKRWPADVVVLGYGANESFAGTAGLADFRRQFQSVLEEMRRLHPTARVVVLGPLAVEEGGPVDPASRNQVLAIYRDVMAETTRAAGAEWVDLFAASEAACAAEREPLTTLGIHLNERGCHAIAGVIAKAFSGGPVNEARIPEIARAAAEKSRRVAELVRPKNGVVYYGVRKRPEEYAAEMPRYFALVEQADEQLHALVRDPAKRASDLPKIALPPLPAGKSNKDRFGGGIIKPPGEQMQEFQVAAGYAVNLFASEEQFPELRNPVQIAFDARGRLWVTTMPSFPHTVPGERPADKILILEDTDRDGKADRCTTFAEGFDALDGIAFHERGVIVSAQPRLLLLNDRDGDDRADQQEELLRGVDVTDSHHGGMVSTDPIGHVLFCDGVFHRSQFETPFGVTRGIDSTTYRLHPQTGRVETEWQTMTPNPWKIAFDRAGNIFQHYGGGHVLDGLPLTWTPLGVFHPYGHGTVLNYNKGCALEVISSPNFPPEYQQGIAQGTLLGSYFVSISTADATDGAMVGGKRLDVLTSPNAAFRPVDIGFGFDGAMYVADFCSSIIGHAQHPMRDPQWDHTHGRIWRVTRTDRPLVKDWPEIEHADAKQLLALLEHPQNIARHHARIRLRAMGPEVIPLLDAWLAKLDRREPAFGSAAMEALWVLAARGQARGSVLEEVLASPDPLARAAAVLLTRFQVRDLPQTRVLLERAAMDPHPRVKMAAISVVARVRAEHPELESAIAHMSHIGPNPPAVQAMLADLEIGLKPRKGRSVPVLEIAPDARLRHWVDATETAGGERSASRSAQKNAKPAPKIRRFRAVVCAQDAQTALLSVKHGYVDVAVNGTQLLSSDSPYSSEQQVEVPLQPGDNLLEVVFRRAPAIMPPISLFDPLGKRVEGLKTAADLPELEAWLRRWDSAHAADANALLVQAVPNQMQFAPKELRVKAGQPVRLIFENRDLMQHNLVLVMAGAAEEVGAQADVMAARPDAMAKHYVPESAKVLHFTKLVEPGKKEALEFTAPREPGRYPYLCTFPGHWRIMRGELIVTP